MASLFYELVNFDSFKGYRFGAYIFFWECFLVFSLAEQSGTWFGAI